MSSTLFGYKIEPQLAIHFTGGGRLQLDAPVPQPKRNTVCFVMFLVLKGELRLCDDLPDGSETYLVRANELHLVAPGIIQYSTAPCQPGTEMLWLHFSFFEIPAIRYLATRDDAERCLRDMPSSPCWLLPRHLSLAGESGIARLWLELRDYSRVFGLEDMGSHQICGHLITALHRVFSDRLLHENIRGSSPATWALVTRARRFMQLNYAKGISLAEVARFLAVTPGYLSRAFRRGTGQSLVDCLQRIRIEAARQLLTSEPAPSIKEIACQTGFSSPAYFCRVFKRLEKATPMQYAAESARARQ